MMILSWGRRLKKNIFTHSTFKKIKKKRGREERKKLMNY